MVVTTYVDPARDGGKTVSSMVYREHYRMYIVPALPGLTTNLYKISNLLFSSLPLLHRNTRCVVFDIGGCLVVGNMPRQLDEG